MLWNYAPGHHSHRLEGKLCTWGSQWALPWGRSITIRPHVCVHTRTDLVTCQNTCSSMMGRALLLFCFNFVSDSFWDINVKNVVYLFPGFIYSKALENAFLQFFYKVVKGNKVYTFPSFGFNLSLYQLQENTHSIVLEFSLSVTVYWRRPILPKFWFKSLFLFFPPWLLEGRPPSWMTQ